MPLFIFDFDHTIADGHTHNIIADLETNDKEQQWASVKNIEAVGGSEVWLNTFRQLWKNGHDVAIASFNAFPHIIPRFLSEEIGLTETEIQKITIVSWLPERGKQDTKNVHIEQIKTQRNFTGRPHDVFLIDDSERNIASAISNGYQGIVARANLEFLNTTRAYSAALAKKPASMLFNYPQITPEVVQEVKANLHPILPRHK